MRGKNYIMINGKRYDAITGLPVSDAEFAAAKSVKPSKKLVHPGSRGTVMSDVGRAPHKPRPALKPAAPKQPFAPHSVTSAKTAHARPQRPSTTLRRSGLKKPVIAPKTSSPANTRSPQISRFGLEPAMTATKTVMSRPQATFARPLAAREPAAPKQPEALSPAKKAALGSRQLKNDLIKQRLRDVDTIKQLDKKKKRSLGARLKAKHPHMGTVIAGIAALVLLGGYLTYVNMPGLSMKIAATRAGVDATYPSYNPAGYHFNGPVAFSDGQVKVQFNSNTNQYAYTVTEQRSAWDSQALLDNTVVDKDNYVTLQDSGLTIYLEDQKASWVNGGVLYSIDYSGAPLSSDQIQKIAVSTL